MPPGYVLEWGGEYDTFDFDDTLLSAGESLAELDAALDATLDTVSEIAVDAPASTPEASFTPPESKKTSLISVMFAPV